MCQGVILTLVCFPMLWLTVELHYVSIFSTTDIVFYENELFLDKSPVSRYWSLLKAWVQIQRQKKKSYLTKNIFYVTSKLNIHIKM